ncbi:chromate resistance protein ChrB domain-containing protein [Rugamonas apoptosis]|uniref:Chromate resistance protein n=1 Tax=Rugamonas apoptosis TaxID=2758570 RepID=A0A7W2IK77_9BURK|nr:chromate resistance protein ChrB domain-containing protein [Rugamonas apoptosis]MBA5687076.1 chromate resistance protein [Rugamonas apoptosis]
MNMLLLILSLPTENAATRMRAWRALRACGAAVLRDGVYLMPARPDCRAALDAIAADVTESGGMAYVMDVTPPPALDVAALFDRGAEHAALMADIGTARARLDESCLPEVLKLARKLRKAFAAIVDIDYFPAGAQARTALALGELELACARLSSPDEPQASECMIARLAVADYQGRTWATRRRPWVDRLACAWLIRRHIDPQAVILWIAAPADCPPDALGFDFDGAAFTHVADRVSFEVLQASFSLDSPALRRLGQLVHYLDVGGVQPPEAAGVESVLAGLRKSIGDDDQLLQAACAVFDGLLLSFQGDTAVQIEETT